MSNTQKELVDEFLSKLKVKFPEIELIKVTKSPESPEDLWVKITAPENEVREIELTEFASELSTDILINHGYLILVMPTRNNEYA